MLIVLGFDGVKLYDGCLLIFYNIIFCGILKVVIFVDDGFSWRDYLILEDIEGCEFFYVVVILVFDKYIYVIYIYKWW